MVEQYRRGCSFSLSKGGCRIVQDKLTDEAVG
jgi:hypothetical protein